MNRICTILTSRWIWIPVLGLILIALLSTLVLRTLVLVTDDSNEVCSENSKVATDLQVGAPTIVSDTFETNFRCFDTGLHLQTDEVYEISIAAEPNWRDLNFEASPDGFSNWKDSYRLNMIAALPLRRHLTDGWFVLMGKIGHNGDAFPIRKKRKIKAAATGRLFLYVNDALPPWPTHTDDCLEPYPGRAQQPQATTGTPPPRDKNCSIFYDNNTGSARVTVERLSK